MAREKERTYAGSLVIEGDGWTNSSNRLICSPYLSAMQLRVYLVLKTFGGYKSVFPSLNKLIKRSNAAKNTVLTAIRNLEDLELLVVERERLKGDGSLTSNRYILKNYEKWEDHYRKKTGLPLIDMALKEEEGSE